MDGTFTTAAFLSPTALTIDTISQTLYVIDIKTTSISSSIIRKIYLNEGFVYTVAGGGKFNNENFVS